MLVGCLLSLMLCACGDLDPPAERWEHAIEGSSAGALSADGRWALHASLHHNLALWDNETQGLIYQWQLGESANPVYLARFSPNGKFVVTATEQQFAVWSVESGQSLGWYNIPSGRIRDIAISDNAEGILYGQSNGLTVFLNRVTGRRIEF